jgi:hypothetical protein
MPATFAQCRTALANTLTHVTNLRASAIYTSVVNPPMAIVLPSTGGMIQWVAMGNVVNYMFRVPLLVTYAEDSSSQAQMDAYLNAAGAVGDSALEAIHQDPSLGGTVAMAIPTSVSSYGLIEWAGVQYFGTNILVTVMV